MYCARCGHQVGIRDAICGVCGFDLNSAGALRLTDPKKDPDFVGYIPPASADSNTENIEDLPGTKDEQDDGSLENSALDSHQPEQDSAVEAEPDELDNESDHVTATQLDAGTTELSPAGNSLVSKFREHLDDQREAAKQFYKERPSESQIAKMLGVEAVSATRLTTMIVILLATFVVIGILMAQLLNMDRDILDMIPHRAISASQSPTASKSLTEQPAEQSDTQTQSPEPSQTPSTLKTPQMITGAKQCETDVWAGPQTSCALALAVSGQVDRTMSGEAEISAYSDVTNRDYKLKCSAAQGITCEGEQGVTGVYVWIVT